jgi:ketosteroid isomerase-like protein
MAVTTALKMAPAMGTDGEEAARRFAEAITSGDRESAIGICHPEIEFFLVLGISGRAYLGHDGVLQYLDDVESAWEDWTVEVERIVEAQDGRVVIVMTMHARGRGSGVTLAARTAHIWTLRDGRLFRNQPYREPKQALQDVGLSAD